MLTCEGGIVSVCYMDMTGSKLLVSLVNLKFNNLSSKKKEKTRSLEHRRYIEKWELGC